MLDPNEMVPAGAHEGYRKTLTELHCGGKGIEKIDATSMSRFPNLEVLWLNGNKLSKLHGLDHNFRLKHLYLHDNCITTLSNNSCCVGKLLSLETLQLAGNQLQDLKGTLAVLSQLRGLRKLCLHNNPLALEGSYRESVIFSIPTLEQLDATVVTPVEREAAVKLFTAKRIEKKYAFGTVPKVWEKPAIISIGDLSVGETQLRREIRQSTRRRQVAAARERVVEEQQVQRPRFDITYSTSATGLLSAGMGAPNVGAKTFEFVARGRVPKLLVRLGRLTMTQPAKHAAKAIGEAASIKPPAVHVAITAMGVLNRPLVSRDVLPAQIDSDGEAAFLRFEEFLFEPSAYADAYDKVQQLKRLGRFEDIAVGVALRESATATPIGTARIPLSRIFEEHTEGCYEFPDTPLYPSRRAGMNVAADVPVAHVSVSLVTDWGLSNTSGGEYGNSAFEFARSRMAKAEHGERSADRATAVHAVRGKRVPRDKVVFKVSEQVGGSAGDSSGALSLSVPAGFKFDAAAYAEYEKAKSMLEPVVRGELSIPL
jgi:hypothetical protein